MLAQFICAITPSAVQELGCPGDAPAPCADTAGDDTCQDYVSKGECSFDFVKKDCAKSCGLCPGPDGEISSDAYTGPNGHYYLGSSRRRVGAGFGRRRQPPVPEVGVCWVQVLGAGAGCWCWVLGLDSQLGTLDFHPQHPINKYLPNLFLGNDQPY